MSISDIDDTVEGFVRGATVAHMSGFDGVQIHAAHGCEYHPSPSHGLVENLIFSLSVDLLAQFMSPKVRSTPSWFHLRKSSFLVV